jgi:hypothetical protein
MGGTEQIGSDRHAVTVVAVLSPRRIQVQRDLQRLVEGNMLSERQRYEFTPNPKAPVETVSLRKDGRWRAVGQPFAYWNGIRLGHRDAHRDPHV